MFEALHSRVSFDGLLDIREMSDAMASWVAAGNRNAKLKRDLDSAAAKARAR